MDSTVYSTYGVEDPLCRWENDSCANPEAFGEQIIKKRKKIYSFIILFMTPVIYTPTIAKDFPKILQIIFTLKKATKPQEFVNTHPENR